ncbi:alpha/beta hydrolase [Staphylococcus gallinarum]|uniref:alpha/beta hydrolase n=1 Tax=Staphylococcus gallinarum TaxID=1293 RepID=UPI001E42BFE0|nr:alpha/beta hydrolase [Staphylococcus gallinarum]MCD8917436.1 alpha/beta hydrolase [Staphylococcus gallinarum]
MTQQTSSCLTTDGFSLPYTTITANQDDVKGVIVYYHGGGLIFGQPNDLEQAYIDILTENYHLILVSYRLAPESNLETIISDALLNFDHIQATYPELPLFTFGRSAGAYLAMLVALNKTVAGVIDFYGYARIHTPAFLTANKQFQALSSQLSPNIINQLIQKEPLVTGPIQARYTIYLYARGQAEWINYLGIQSSSQQQFNISPQQLESFPPTFIVHCTGDPDVPYSESEHIHRFIEESHFESLSLNEHDFDRTFNEKGIAIYHKVVQFLNQVVQHYGGDNQ